MTKLKKLWYLDKFIMFSIYTLVFFAISNCWIGAVLGAIAFMILEYFVRKALDKIEIEK